MKKNRIPAIIFIVGPTAIGKTRLSIELAPRINGEIISSDSMQVYKGMRTLSQAPGAPERKKVRHYLVGILDPRKEYSVAAFKARSTRLIASIIKRGKVPIVVGGSGLYTKALIDGLFPSPGGDLKFRSSMQKAVLAHGAKILHERLAGIDPQAAKTIHPNDARRIIRALEIYHSTGKTMTELKFRTRGLKDHYDIRIFGLTRPREEIYKDIETRVDRMFDGPVLDEVKRLKRKRLSKTAKAVLGFKEIMGYLDGEYDLERAKAILKRNTRRFAKRQLTWFRADSRIRWFDLARTSEEVVVRKIAKEAR